MGNREGLHYLNGFGNHFSTEALKDVLPRQQNSPQKVAKGLYTEQLSGSSFLAPRHENLRTWIYRVRPAAHHGHFTPMDSGKILGAPALRGASPEQMRWDPLPIPSAPTDFVTGLVTMVVNGNTTEQKGCAVHVYACNRSMEDVFFYDADGDLLIAPEQGSIRLKTELGVLDVAPKEIAVIPRGVRFQVIVSEPARGYVCENFGQPFRLPYLGPIGSNGLANPRDFQAPVAAFEDKEGKFKLVSKFCGQLWQAPIDHSPLDIVGWQGNYFPYKYDLTKFNTIGTVSFDHPDPSIFTVLTSPSETPGVSNVDFVIFPPRWMVAENTFRPPYYHRNIMSEWMGLIHGRYDAKQKGFVPGGASLHNCMSGHGPDSETFDKASNADLKPHHIDETLAIMFESRYPFVPTPFALEGGLLQKDYLECWKTLKKHFKP